MCHICQVKWLLTHKKNAKKRYNRVRGEISNTTLCPEVKTDQRIINNKQRITDPTIVPVSTSHKSHLPKQLLYVTLARSTIPLHKNSTLSRQVGDSGWTGGKERTNTSTYPPTWPKRAYPDQGYKPSTPNHKQSIPRRPRPKQHTQKNSTRYMTSNQLTFTSTCGRMETHGRTSGNTSDQKNQEHGNQ